MTKVLVIGAGAQGGPSTAILAGEPGITEIILGDINLELAQQVADKVGSSKVWPIRLDASNKAELVKAAAGVDLIMNYTLIKFNHTIMEAALEVQADYVDTACSTEFLQHWISGKPILLDQEFKAIGKTALVGCGFAPGIANILSRYACDQMEQVDKIIIRVGRKSQTAADEVVSEWRPSWSPEIMLEDYAEEPMVFKGGKFVEDPIFSNPETYTFPDPIGDLLLSSHSHEETYLMAKYYTDKGLQELDFKYPVDKIVGALIKMGFANHQPIEVKGVKVAPVDLLMALVKRPGNKFFQENHETILQSDLTGIMDISVDGVIDGEKVSKTISYTFTDGPDKQRQKLLFETFGTTMVYVALPAVAGANMCLNGDVALGVVSPDVLDPATFFERMAERGVPFEFDEKVEKVGD